MQKEALIQKQSSIKTKLTFNDFVKLLTPPSSHTKGNVIKPYLLSPNIFNVGPYDTCVNLN